MSVVIPCHDCEAFVDRAVQSALAQTYRRVEVIVVDDGSTDGSLARIEAYGERIRFVTGPNRGGGAARNRGIELSAGEFVQFLDADDAIHPRKIESQIEILRAHPDAFVTCDWRTHIRGDNEPVHELRMDYPSGDLVLEALARPIQTASPLHPVRRLTEVGGFDPDLPCSQERDLHLRLGCNSPRMVHLPEVLVEVHKRATSVSSDYLRVLETHECVHLRIHRTLAAQGALTEDRARALAQAFARDARHLGRLGRGDLARRYAVIAARLHRSRGLESFHPLYRFLHRALGFGPAEGLARVTRFLRPRSGPGDPRTEVAETQSS